MSGLIRSAPTCIDDFGAKIPCRDAVEEGTAFPHPYVSVLTFCGGFIDKIS
jgi:hypothetical protein